MDCSFARYWDKDASSALEWAISNAPQKTGRELTSALQRAGFALTGRQETILENILDFDQKENNAESLYILSDGQIKEVK